MNKITTKAYLLLQRILPQHLLSRLAGWLASRQWPWLRQAFIAVFMSVYRIDLAEAEREDYKEYIDFNDFFARTLKPQARPIAKGATQVVSPADGCIHGYGQLHDGMLIQAKGHRFALSELLTEQVLAAPFTQGHYVTVYLAPHNYHRVHMPFAGELSEMIHVPGDLFSVSPTTMEHLPVMARNERLICAFDTAHGKMIVILVGAMIVGSIETVWAGRVQGRQLQRWSYQPGQVSLATGDELGQFRLGGSMAIVLFAQSDFQWQHVSVAEAVKMGQGLGAFATVPTQVQQSSQPSAEV